MFGAAVKKAVKLTGFSAQCHQPDRLHSVVLVKPVDWQWFNWTAHMTEHIWDGGGVNMSLLQNVLIS